jgi:histidinol phosphatase-like PHP family hydrolase
MTSAAGPTSDWHIHANAYRGRDERMTVEGIVERCRELGLTSVGILQHLGPNFSYPVDAVRRMSDAFHKRPASGPCKAYLAAEVEIDFEGNLDIPPGLREELKLDYLMAVVHHLSPDVTSVEGAIEDCFTRTRLVAERRSAEVIAHPWRDMPKQLRRAGLPDAWDYDMIPAEMQAEFGRTLAQQGVAAEVNPGEVGFSRAYLEFLSRLIDAGVALAPGSDAHTFDRLGGTLAFAQHFERAGEIDGGRPPDAPTPRWWLPGA